MKRDNRCRETNLDNRTIFYCIEHRKPNILDISISVKPIFRKNVRNCFVRNFKFYIILNTFVYNSPFFPKFTVRNFWFLMYSHLLIIVNFLCRHTVQNKHARILALITLTGTGEKYLHAFIRKLVEF